MDSFTNNPGNQNSPQSFFEKLRNNQKLTIGIVFTTLVVIAGIIGGTIWSIMGLGDESLLTNNKETEQQKTARLEAERQSAHLKQQAMESQQIIQERNIKPPTPKELSQQASASKKIIQERNIKPPTQAQLDQQAAESNALLEAMKQSQK